MPFADKKQNAYSGRVVPKAARTDVVSLDKVRRELTARTECTRTTTGETVWAVVIPTPGKREPEHRLELEHWKLFPSLAEPLAHSFLAIMREQGAPSTRSNLINTAKYFQEYLSVKVLRQDWSEFGLSDITTPVVAGFIAWLNRTHSETGAEVLAVGTRRKALATLRRSIGEARRGKWENHVPVDLSIRQRVWPGADRQHTPTAVITLAKFALLYRTCVAEAMATMKRFEDGCRAIEMTRSIAEEHKQGEHDYDDLGVRLATLNSQFPGLLPKLRDLKDATEARRVLIAKIVKHGGIGAHAPYFYPSPRALVPFVLLLAIHTAYNPDMILSLSLRDIQEVDVMGQPRTSFDMNEEVNEVPTARTLFTGAKGRARGQRQKRTTPVTSDPDNPAVLLDFLRRWTARIRALAKPHDLDQVFLFLPEKSSRQVGGFGSRNQNPTNSQTWQTALRAFLTSHSLDRCTLRQVRATCIDHANLLFDGDLRAMLAVGQQRSINTVDEHYTSDGARQRNDERLGGAVNLMWRDRANQGRSDARRATEFGGDPGAATPGWGCLDPYDSPLLGQVCGRLCAAYGSCPICPLAQVNQHSPVSCYYAYDLLGRIDEAREALAPANWLLRWGPVRTRLKDYWLPLFDEEVTRKAASLQLRRIPAVV